MSYWPRAYAWIRVIEGGFFNHPSDPGGATYAGVSLRAVLKLDRNKDGKLDFDLDGDGDVDLEDIKALAGHPEKIEAYYLNEYWGAARCFEMPWPLSLYVFDSVVHHGVAGGVGLLQRGLGVDVDGKIGPKTLAAAQTASPFLRRRVLAERSCTLARIRARATAKAIGSLTLDRFTEAFADDPFLLGWMQRIQNLHAEGFSGMKAA